MLLERVKSARVIARSSKRVAGTLLCVFEGVRDGFVADALSLEGLAVSKGAACRAGLAEASPSLLAMGVTDALARTATRISFGSPLARIDTEHLVSTLERVLSI